MDVRDLITAQDREFLLDVRRTLHRHPELGFDLPQTLALVRRSLTDAGIHEFVSYGESTVCAYIGRADAPVTVGLRADMDALPVEEKTGLPFSSEIAGQMHACGHDAHTAILLTVARILKRHEDRLPCRVKLLFEPSEECAVSGAQMMVENGAADDVDMVIAAHCEPQLQTGTIGYHYGDYMAACDPITVLFHGKTAHATMPENGVDALAMAVEAYGTAKKIAAELAGGKPYIMNIGVLQAGHVHNVIADTAKMCISFRYYDLAMRDRVRDACMQAFEEIAARIGGSVQTDWYMSAPPLKNDEQITRRFVESVKEVCTLAELPTRMSTEDFSWFLTKKPGMLFRFGIRNEEKGCVGAAHCNDFHLDEDAMPHAASAFLQFIYSL